MKAVNSGEDARTPMEFGRILSGVTKATQNVIVFRGVVEKPEKFEVKKKVFEFVTKLQQFLFDDDSIIGNYF